MAGRVRDRIAEARRRAFVGRAAELELVDAALAGDPAGFAVLFVHGPGGIGKSALLQMVADRAGRAGRTVLTLDGHDVRAHPQAVREVIGQTSGPVVVLVDTYELLEPVDAWLRDELVPELADGSLVVIAGRNPPPPGWRVDPGWRDLLRVVRLGPLPARDATDYLSGAGVAAELRAPTVAATHGHPLALVLAADALRAGTDPGARLLDVPDVLAALVSRLVDGVPDALHRAALGVCALARFTTEPLLRDVLDLDDAHAPFGWLRALACVESGPHGLYPHDLARDVLDADLRWRDEDRHRELAGRIMARTQHRIASEGGRARQEAIFDLFFSTRTDPVAGRYWDSATFGSVVGEPVRAGDRTEILDLVAAHEGASSAAIAAWWLDRRPDRFTVHRRGDGPIDGVVAWLILTAGTDTGDDPLAAAARRHAAEHGPLGPGEEIALQRFQIDRTAYQHPSPTVDLTSMIHVELAVTRPRLAWVMIVVADAGYWAPFFGTIGHLPGPEATVGDRRYTLFTRDTREPGPIVLPDAPAAEPDDDELLDGLRAALHDLGRVDRLAANPLLGLRQVRDRGGGPDALRALLVEAAATMRGHHRDDRLFRALDRTYLRPAPTQERAAEMLGLPFSTYRRHRREGVARIVAILRAGEDGAGPAEGGRGRSDANPDPAGF